MSKTIEELIIDNEEISDELIREDFKNFENIPCTCLDEKANALDKIVEAFRYSKGICEEFGIERDCGNPYFIHPYTVAKILYDLRIEA